MSDLEKKFEALRHHEVVPPPPAWKQLNDRLTERRKRRVGVYWQVAAAVALVLSSVIVINVFYQQDTVSPIAESSLPLDSTETFAQSGETQSGETQSAVLRRDEIPSSKVQPNAAALAERAEETATSTEIVARTNRAASQRAEPVTSPLADRRTTSEATRTVVAAQRRDSKLVERIAQKGVASRAVDQFRVRQNAPDTAKQVLPSSVTLRVPTVAQRKDQSQTMTKVMVVLKHDSTKTMDTQAKRPATAVAERPTVAQRRIVKVIYKPGRQSAHARRATKEGGLFAKTLSFIGTVKENGIGYAELRSAKSELVDTMFSRDSE